MMLVLHDDVRREYAYGPAEGLPDTKVGTFTQGLYNEAQAKGWFVISMKNDWKRIFAFEALNDWAAMEGSARWNEQFRMLLANPARRLGALLRRCPMRSRFALLAGALVVPFVAACASQSATTPLQAPASAPTQSVRADIRFGLTAKQLEAIYTRRGNGYFHGKKQKPTLFVSDIDAGAIRLFPANKKDPKQSGSITTGIDLPVNIAVIRTARSTSPITATAPSPSTRSERRAQA